MDMNIKNIQVLDFLKQKMVVVLLFALILVLFMVGEIISEGFLSYDHVSSVLRTAAFLGLVSFGQTIAILTAGIDLSVGPVITMGNVFSCMIIYGSNINTLWALPAIILLGGVFGLMNGVGVSYLKISPLVMTLAVGSLVTGVTLIFSQGAPKGLISPVIRTVSVGSLAGFIPIMVLLWIILSAFFVFMLKATAFGRKIYYIGANERAAFLSGIRVKIVKMFAYSVSGAAAAFTGALMAGYTHTAFLGIGSEYILWSIAAVVIGGTSLAGGKGGYVGTFAGATILVLLESILTLLKMPEAGRRIVEGIIILILISIYFRGKRQRI